jgi:HAD superfamily hydrolase (TIGR01509 family)
MKFEGIIFDFNGVLWWDTHLQEFAWKQFSEQIRGKPFSSEEITVHVHGRNNQHTLEYLTGNSVVGDDLECLTQQKEAIYKQLCLKQEAEFKLSPGTIELLNYLVAQSIPHTIATASGKTNLDFFVEHLRLRKWFDLTKIVYDDGSRPGKPAPDIYLEAANRLELKPMQCIVVEDSHSGIEAAYTAGIEHIVALGPADTHQRLSKLKGVNRVVESLEEIPKEQLF